MAELLENLEIKWQLLAAQTVNFFILLFILKKFLYKPMLKFLKERREAIEEGLKKADLAEQKFKELREIQARELSKTRQEAQKIIDDSKRKAIEAKNQIVTEAREDVERIFKKSEKDIEQMKNQRMAEAEQELGKLALEGMEHLLQEQMPEEKKASLQEKAIEHIKKLKHAS